MTYKGSPEPTTKTIKTLYYRRMKHKRARAHHLLVGFSATINRSSLRLSLARETDTALAARSSLTRGSSSCLSRRGTPPTRPTCNRPTDRPTATRPRRPRAQLTVGNLLLDQTVYINHAVGTAVGCPRRAQGCKGWGLRHDAVYYNIINR